MKELIIGITGLVVLAVGYFLFVAGNEMPEDVVLDAAPRAVQLSGTYVCLPHLDTSGPQTEECAFGLQTDAGEYYAVNFGASQDSMSQFQSGAHIEAEGFIVIKEALSSDHWAKYNMVGIFTVTRVLSVSGQEPADMPAAKININAVCEGALAYMTFESGAAADAFVSDCKEGKHPEVIEEWKKQMGIEDDRAI